MSTRKVKTKATAQAAGTSKGQTQKANTTKKAQKEQELDKANSNVTAKKITDKKDLKYKYPKLPDGMTKDEQLAHRKKYRGEVRRKLRSLEKEIKKLEMSKAPEDMELAIKKTEELERAMRKHLTMAKV